MSKIKEFKEVNWWIMPFIEVIGHIVEYDDVKQSLEELKLALI